MQTKPNTGLYEIFRGTEEMACAISRGNRISRGDQEKNVEFLGVLVFVHGVLEGVSNNKHSNSPGFASTAVQITRIWKWKQNV